MGCFKSQTDAQNQVKDDQLTTKQDPCIGEKKRLRVRYLFRDVVHEVEVDDVSQLRAPVKAHALDQ